MDSANSYGQVSRPFGLSGAGKTTLSVSLVNELRAKGLAVLSLDGDGLRTGLCPGLGFSDTDRTENIRRTTEVARLAVESAVCVVAAFIAPLNSQRQLVQEIIGSDRTSLIFVDASLDVCKKRDVKGLYAKAHAGKVVQMTGIGSSFELPSSVAITLPTAIVQPHESAHELKKLRGHASVAHLNSRR